MKHDYVYDAHYLEFNEENNELEYQHKYLSKEMSKWQFAKVAIITILITFLICSFFVALLSFGIIENGGSVVLGIFISGLLFYTLGACICFGRLIDYDKYLDGDFDSDLIDKLFSQEIEELKALSILETLKAAQWRAAHPLEEKCRLALTKNPNYVADLIKYVKENNNE